MRITQYQAHNCLGIKDIDFNMAGRHLFIVGGKNDQGKTSAIMALLMAICGKQKLPEYPEVPLRTGEREGWVKVSLEGDDPDLHEYKGLTLELKWEMKRGKGVVEEFRLLDSSGEEAPEPRKILSSLYNLKGFDPLSFERLAPKEKSEYIRNMLGLDFSKDNAEHKKTYDERTLTNRELKTAQARFDAMKFDTSAPKVKVDTAALMVSLRELEGVKKTNEAKRKALLDQQARCENNVAEIGKVEAHIKQLQADLEVLMRGGQTLCDDRDKLRAEVEALVEPDTAAVEQQISAAGATNEAVQKNLDREAARKVVDELEGKAKVLSDKLDAIAEKKTAAIKAAEWPLPEMGMDDDGALLMNGLPFEQTNKAQRIVASVKIGMAANPKLRLLVCQNGSDLDTDTLEVLDKLLKENDFQMIVELVTRTEADEDLCAVVIKDGEIKGE